MQASTRRWLKVLIAFGVSAVIAVLLAYQAASAPSGPFGNLVLGFLTLAVIGSAGVFAIVALVVALWRRQLEWPLLLGATSVGLLSGLFLGVRMHETLCCLNRTSEPIRSVALDSNVRLQWPYSLELEADGWCDVDTSTEDVQYVQINAINREPHLELEFWGLPTSERSSGPYASFDVIVFDGDRGWGYRPTDWSQVEVVPRGPLEGTTRLVGLPLLEDTRPSGSPVPEVIDAEIDWRCDRDTPL